MRKKIAIIGTAGVPARYGGFETLAHQMVSRMNLSHELTVYCSGKLYKNCERKKYWKGARLVFLPFRANGLQSIIYDIVSMVHALFFADVLVVLGVSGGIMLPLIKRFTKKKIVVNIDGVEWRRDKWSTPVKKFLYWSEKLAVNHADAFITDNEALQEYAVKEHGILSHLVEYGSDHARHQPLNALDYKAFPFLHAPYAFSVCRIEPENNVHLILDAFRIKQFKALVIVGNWDASEYGRNLKSTYADCNNIFMIDPIYDQITLDKLRSNCHLYLHGHSAGGTNPSLVEAMNLRLPIVAFDVSFNRKTTEDHAIYFQSSEDLADIIQRTSYVELQEIALKMVRIAKRRYQWKKICGRYEQLIMAFDYSYRKKPVSSIHSKLDQSQLLKSNMGHLKNTLPFYEAA